MRYQTSASFTWLKVIKSDIIKNKLIQTRIGFIKIKRSNQLHSIDLPKEPKKLNENNNK